jgi:trehalose-phosphatase
MRNGIFHRNFFNFKNAYKHFSILFFSYISDAKSLVLFLDYDGTLAPIQPNPQNTQLRPETKDLLKKLSKNENIFMSVISGRGVNDVRQRVGLNNIIYGGNHGLEISYPNGTTHNYQLSEQVKSNYLKLLSELESKVRRK